MGASDLRGVTNAAFSAYYKQQLGLTDQEWSALEACLRSPLPVTWRFSGNDERAISLRASMEQSLLPLLNEQPTSLPWYPDRLGWQFGVSRAWLRGKDRPGEGPEGPEAAAAAAPRSTSIKAFHAWLLRESSLGNLQRQEAVSMVPPLLLDVRPGMAVLDMCALL